MKKRLQTRQDRILTLANAISISRIFLCFPVIWYLERGELLASFTIIILMILSDLLDGFVARRADEITNFGKLIDPVADKICIMVVIIFLIFKYGIWFILFLGLLTLRDVIIITIGIYLMNVQEKVFQSNWSGKWFIFITAIMIICFIYNLPQWLGIGMYSLSIILMIISTIQYINSYRHYLKNIEGNSDLLV